MTHIYFVSLSLIIMCVTDIHVFHNGWNSPTRRDAPQSYVLHAYEQHTLWSDYACRETVLSQIFNVPSWKWQSWSYFASSPKWYYFHCYTGNQGHAVSKTWSVQGNKAWLQAPAYRHCLSILLSVQKNSPPNNILNSIHNLQGTVGVHT